MGRDLDQFGPVAARRAPRSARLPRIAAALLSVAVAGCGSPLRAGEAREAAFGALVLRWDADVWEVTDRPGGFQASCLAPACKGRLAMGSVTPGGDCEPPPTERRQDPRETGIESGPLRWRVATWWLGCRNAHPKSVAACALHDGNAYRVSAPLLSCRTGPGHGAETEVMNLVRGIRP